MGKVKTDKRPRGFVRALYPTGNTYDYSIKPKPKPYTQSFHIICNGVTIGRNIWCRVKAISAAL